MLGIDAGAALILRLWEKAPEKTVLPPEFDDYFVKSGPLPARQNEQRAYARHYLRDRAILKLKGKVYGVYCRDLSREGVGVLAPRQLLPLQEVRLLLPLGKAVTAIVRRCRRIDENCYELGLRLVEQAE